MVEYEIKPPEPQALLAAIVTSSDDAIVSKNLDGIVTSWNPAAERIFGFTAEEMVGRHITTIIPDELRFEEEQIIRQIRAGQRVDHFETERVGKHGRRIALSLTISPIRDNADKVIGASKVAREIGLHKEAARVRALLAAIVDSSEDAIVSKNLDGTVTSWNAAAERLYGFDAREMIGRSIRKVIPAELQHEEDTIISKIRAGERIDHYRTVRIRKDGRTVAVSLTVSPIRDDQGRIIGASKVARDISQEQEAARRKDEFLAILAHELRNPLAPITAALEIIDHPDIAAERGARALDIARRQLRHMTRLLDDLLDVARISTGRVELKVGRFELAAVLEEAIAVARPAMEAKEQSFHASIAPDGAEIEGDRARVLQIVANLLTNANKYTPAGGRIELSATRVGPVVELSVQDNGIGMSKGVLANMFTLFERGDTPDARSQGGLGIGLALVKEFVERHGGSVRAFSEGPGAGSRFVVRLPVVTARPLEA